LIGLLLDRFDNSRHHLVTALVDLAVRVLQLARSEARTQLLAHRPPFLAIGEEQTIGQHRCGRVQVNTVVGEVREVLDQYRVDQLRVADQQHRVPHLIESEQLGVWKTVVEPFDHVSGMFESQHHSGRVAKQWYRRYVRNVQYPPFIVRRSRIIVEARENSDETQTGDVVVQPISHKPYHDGLI